MTKEELFKEWIIFEDYEKEFYKDLNKWFNAELKRNAAELQKGLKDKETRKEFTKVIWRLIKGESMESIEEDYMEKND